MDDRLALLLPVAAVWLAAGLVAEGLPGLDRARALRRRTGWLSVLVLTGLALTAAVLAAGLQSAGDTTVDRAAAALGVAAVPAAVVAVCTVRRVRRLRSGAGAFAAAPETPAPHGLRAAAAHPLIALPLQATAIAVLVAVLPAIGVDLFTAPGVAGPVITVGVLGVCAIGVRHALRHNRLAERAMPAAEAVSARPARALHV
ncbi:MULTISPECIES: hypothetical protein [Micromonospora]|uniref:hypothetical protein n=1 Tax=Micromonospora TaxID=1873 RepID=UPI0001C46A56|nr:MULTISPECIES: hypothetical protein [Micromonospora]ADU05628.1 uncharacterized membrane protein, putative virulence factor [Micromonospora sp. L5]MBC9004044.1 hypothetical protein [Micromonospora aurantiaca]OHX04943.1 hypothetical protein BFV98_19125 [Micromonospora sp. WMMB235]SCL39372.1 hypothetical protein GA0070615_4024 [Micromonospora aurantiaca]